MLQKEVLQVPESSPENLLKNISKSAHRGVVMVFICDNSVTLEELKKTFGDTRELGEALGGLWDRRQIHCIDGKYSLAPEREWVTRWDSKGRARW